MSLIGLSCYVEPIRHGDWEEESAFTPSTYVASIDRAGGTPLLLPPSQDSSVVAVLDGLVIIGGPDVDPGLYGAAPHRRTDAPRVARDAWEILLIRAALDADLPLLCICRGIQLLNVALGGTLHQHLEEVVGHTSHLAAVGEMNPNPVIVEPGTKLASIFTAETLGMCHHHQAVDRLGEGLVVSATALDGTVEAVEVADRAWALAVQWHPEEDPSDTRLFDAFLSAARNRAAAG